MGMLMDDMTIEIGREAMAKSPKLTMSILQDMASDFEGRVGDLPAQTKPAAQALPDNPNRHYIGTEPIIPNKDNTGWIYEKTGKAVQ